MLDRLRLRVRQSIRAFAPSQMPADVQESALKLLTPRQRESFAALSRFDQDHLLCVYRSLKNEGHADQDLLTAGLLHDIGKQQRAARVRFADRVARVLMARFAPDQLVALAQPPATGWRAGLVLAVHHPEFGANHARALGFNERVCELIRHHEIVDNEPSGALAALQRADSAC
jgi:putative nucleotidyltransferase with HDIG domain